MTTAERVEQAAANGDAHEVVRLRDAWTKARYADVSDRELSMLEVAIDQQIAEERQYDDGADPELLTRLNKSFHAVRHELARRECAGEVFTKPGESYEERHAPFGEEWRLEQQERQDAGYALGLCAYGQ